MSRIDSPSVLARACELADALEAMDRSLEEERYAPHWRARLPRAAEMLRDLVLTVRGLNPMLLPTAGRCPRCYSKTEMVSGNCLRRKKCGWTAPQLAEVRR